MQMLGIMPDATRVMLISYMLNGVIVLLFMSLVVLALAPRLRLSDLIGRIWKRK
jgi:hypothetical protein